MQDLLQVDAEERELSKQLALALTPRALGVSIKITHRKGTNAMCDWKVPLCEPE